MSRGIVHEESLTLGTLPLLGVRWVSRHPEVVVGIEMGILETLG